MVHYMLAQVLENLFPGKTYTSDGTWESVVFDNGMARVPDEWYERELYKVTNAEAFNKLREERNTRLNESDRYMNRDYPHLFNQDFRKWMDYRQALRVLPMTAQPTLDKDGNLTGVEWPAFPTPAFPTPIVPPEEPVQPEVVIDPIGEPVENYPRI